MRRHDNCLLPCTETTPRFSPFLGPLPERLSTVLVSLFIHSKRGGVAVRNDMKGSMNLLGETICPYCGVGCRLKFESNGGDLRVRGVVTAAANLGGICAKGAQLGPTIHTPDRLSHPQLRLCRPDDFRRFDWTTAFRYLREIFTNILNAHGPDAIAFYGSGQLDTETVY